jgi:hypothetical protein
VSDIDPAAPSESGWLANRFELRDAIRERRRYAAIAFNGLFLLAVAGLGRSGATDVALLLCGLALTVVGITLAMSRDPVGRAIRRETERASRRSGFSGGIPVGVVIRRAGVELGRDRGWVARHQGALLFEGATTRFGIVRDDLVELPVVAPHARRALLRVLSERGEMEVEFVAGPMPNSLALGQTIHGWPDALRCLPGPPTQPNRRTPAWYLQSHFDRLAKADSANWSVAGLALGGVVSALVLSVMLVYLVATFFWFVYRDTVDRARLLALES